MTRRLAVIALALVTLCAGCVGSRWMRPQAFVPPLRHYRIRYDDPARHAVLPDGWRVLNHDGGGVRQGTEWWAEGAVEVDEGTGRVVSRPRFDLYAEHAEDGATLFVRTMPIPHRLAPRSLERLAHALVGTTTMASIFVDRDPAHGVQVRSSEIALEAPAEVGGVEAYYVTVHASVDGARRIGSAATITLVLLRPGAWRWRPSGLATSEGAPMLVVVGYASSADDHAAHLDELHALLARLDVRPGEP